MIWDRGLAALPSGNDRDDIKELCPKFFVASKERSAEYLSHCWNETNALMNTSVLDAIKILARELRANKRLSGDDLEQIFSKHLIDASQCDAAVERILSAFN